MKPTLQILASAYLLRQKPSSEVLRQRKSAKKVAEELAQYKASWKYKMRGIWIGPDQMEAKIASGKYVLSSHGMTGSWALRLITQFAMFQGLIVVALKTCGIGYTLNYNDPVAATIDVIKAVIWVDSCEAYDKIDDITAEVKAFTEDFKTYLSGLRNPPPKYE
nr:hypothetical protein CFP56_08946 [Quercus suber]